MKSRFATGAFALALATTLVAGLAVAQAPQPTPPAAAAEPAQVSIPAAPVPAKSSAWLVMDHATGQVLAGENIDARVEPASITKVMTAYVVAAEQAAGRVKPDDQVLMSELAWREGGARTDGSFSGFPVNQTAPLRDMIAATQRRSRSCGRTGRPPITTPAFAALSAIVSNTLRGRCVAGSIDWLRASMISSAGTT